jgi:circadian clock protein KaiB
MKLENATSDINPSIYKLKLFICDGEANSRLARANLTEICNENLKGHYQIEEVDVLIDFTSALKERVFVTPALILKSPEPRVTLVGNLDNKERVISALRLRS